MSYILDALRKSAAERERGMTPGLNTPAIGPAPEALAAARHTKMAFYGAVAFALLLLGAIVWLLLTRPVPAPDARPAPPSPHPIAALPQPAPALAALTPSQPPTPSPEPEQPPASVPDTTPKATVTAKAKPPRAKETPTPIPLVVALPTASEPRIYAVSELPDNIRATLPQLTISGAVYAQTPANRMLIVSGQIYHESDEPTPGLQVEHIRPKEAILKYQGYRYRQSYP